MKENPAAGGAVKAGEDLGQRRFPAARFPYDAQGFPFMKADIDMVRRREHLAAAQVEHLADILHPEYFFSITLHAILPPSTGTAERSIFVYSSFGW